MRILGEIPHQKYKITMLEMNKKTVLQIEDVDVVQLYRFREGVLKNYNDLRNLDAAFYQEVERIFKTMRENKNAHKPILDTPSDDDYIEII